MSTGRFDTTLEVDDLEVDVTIEYDATYQAERISGPPEKCCPADGELDLLSCEPVMSLPPEVLMSQLRMAAVKAQTRLEELAWEDFHSHAHEREIERAEYLEDR